MNNWNYTHYHPTTLVRGIQILLLVLIVVGVGLLAFQKLWVPQVVQYILNTEKVNTVGAENTLPKKTPSDTQTPPTVRPGKVDTGVEGIVTIGPTCPVEHYPPEPGCSDRGYQTTLVITPDQGGTPISVQTDAKGYFYKDLAVGSYTIELASREGLTRMTLVHFPVTLHQRTALNIKLDSGMR